MQQSAEINELVKALVKARTVIQHPKKDSTAKAGSFSYSYASLPTVIDAFVDAGLANGIMVTQTVGMDGLTTQLAHTSGQWIRDTMPIIGLGNRPQDNGSAITYARRYALSALFCIAAEDDDDGATAQNSANHTKNPTPTISTAKPKVVDTKVKSGYNGSQTHQNVLLEALNHRGIPAEFWEEIGQHMIGKSFTELDAVVAQVRG